MSEEKTQLSNTNSPEGQPLETDDSSVDYKSLYLDEVQNAKKLRKRAQDSEVVIQDFTKSQETNKVKQLKEQEKFKELSENLQARLDEASPYKERWETHETNERENLLSQLPEEDRESLSNKDLDTLKYIVNLKKEDSKPSNPSHTPGMTRAIQTKKSWAEMSDDERRAMYEESASRGFRKP